MENCNNKFSISLLIASHNLDIPDLTSTTAIEVIQKLNLNRNPKKSIAVPENYVIPSPLGTIKSHALSFLKQGIGGTGNVSKSIDLIFYYFSILNTNNLLQVFGDEKFFQELRSLPRVGNITISCLMFAMLELKGVDISKIEGLPRNDGGIHMSSIKEEQMLKLKSYFN